MIRKEYLTKVELYQPVEDEQILLPEKASCLASQTFLKMCKVEFEVFARPNAEYMSPGGRLSKLPVMRVGQNVASEFSYIVKAVISEDEDYSNHMLADEKLDMCCQIVLAENVLTLAEYYICFRDKDVYQNSTKPRIKSVYPWPLSLYRCSNKKNRIDQMLKSYQWYDMDITEVLEKVDTCCDNLSVALERSRGHFFYGKDPCELDALAFGHVYTILNTDLPNNVLAKTIEKYERLKDHCQFIKEIYFKN